jgi:amidase
MHDTELAFTSALDQATLVQNGEVSPVELTDLYLARIERLNPQLDAYLTVAADRARATAREAEAEVAAGTEDLPPFLGVPIAIKDLNDTLGIVTTHGTAGWNDRIPEADDHVVSRIRDAGFVILGKTNTPEFGSAPVTESPGYPPARNPWNLDRTPGGSSGGSAAATAAGLCAIAQGSDGGGSIRIPSALCGLFGIKPARGRISTAPYAPSFHAVNGPIARTVADAAAMLDAVSGYATGDPWWAAPPSRPFLDEVGAAPGRLRIALATEPMLTGIQTAPGNRDAAERAGALLESLGHVVELAAPEWPFDAASVQIVTVAPQMAAREADLPPLDTLDPVNRFLVEAGRTIPATTYLTSSADLISRVRPVIAFFDDYDLLLTPTVPIPAPPIGEYTTMGARADLQEFLAKAMLEPAEMPAFADLGRFTSAWNVTGQPAVSVPLYQDDDGLPLGVQLVGRPADEATLIRVASQLEQACPWRDRRPPMAMDAR